MAKLEKEKVRQEHYYSVGYSKGLQKYVMRICITYIFGANILPYFMRKITPFSPRKSAQNLP